MEDRASALVTLLFTDLVGSTEFLARAGDERAQRVLRAHHDLLAKAAATHGGQEVKWLGDGLMVAFPSAAEAVRCAMAMQEESRRPIQGERLAIRVGLNAGEALRDEADFFGLPVVIARRLCDRADGGQILCSEVVAGLLVGRPGFVFSDLGKLELKGVPDPVGACEIRYEVELTAALTSRTYFVGRETEMRRLSARLGEAAAGSGGLVVVAGEPGIGKTRLAEELAERAPGDGALVVWGRCLEREWAPPYAPFAEALDALLAATEPDLLRADLGPGAPPLAQLVPRVRQILPDVPEPAPVQPDEERFRLLDATAQFLAARSRRTPVLLCLDDLHWADRGTVAMLRHLARFAPRSRLLILGTYRDAEVGPDHPLTDALAALRREVDYERIDLRGLELDDVEELIAAFAEHEVSRGFVAAVGEETDGNPLFIRELIRHFVEVGTVYRGPDGRWTSGRSIRELGIPEGVREVIGRRLSRLSEAARRLLAVAAAFEGPFRFDVVRAVADLGEDEALDAVDGALTAQVLEPAGTPDAYTFAHALIRHTLYDGLSNSRQVRLHRRVAEALEAAYGPEASPAQAGEIAAQYHRSAGLPGAERGVDLALRAAAHAESTGAHDGSARFLRMALALLPAGDSSRPRLLGRLGIALAWALAFDEAVEAATEAGEAIAGAEGDDAALEYLSEAARACGMAGGTTHAWALARQGLRHAGAQRDVAWARLVSYDLERRAAEDPEHPGIPLDTPERREAARILRAAGLDPFGLAPMEGVFDSREEVYTSTNLVVLAAWAGEYARCFPLFQAEAEAARSRGQLARAVRCWALVAQCGATFGRLDEARQALAEAETLVARLGQPGPTRGPPGRVTPGGRGPAPPPRRGLLRPHPGRGHVGHRLAADRLADRARRRPRGDRRGERRAPDARLRGGRARRRALLARRPLGGLRQRGHRRPGAGPPRHPVARRPRFRGGTRPHPRPRPLAPGPSLGPGLPGRVLRGRRGWAVPGVPGGCQHRRGHPPLGCRHLLRPVPLPRRLGRLRLALHRLLAPRGRGARRHRPRSGAEGPAHPRVAPRGARPGRAGGGDGRRRHVHSWLVLPEEASATSPAPLVVFIHGGPLGSWKAWHWRWNPWLLAARGYAVLCPDPALSTGYGQAFIQRGWGRWGAEPYTDLMAAVDAACARPDIDGERTAAMGGSFGGYMANWVAGHADRFSCIVTHASLWALDQFHGTTDHGMWWEREFGDPYADPSRYEEHSPHRHVGRITTPMLVIHGERDHRVPVGEALRLWTDLSRHGVEAKFLYFPDENHWILKPQHARVWYETVFAWLDHHLLGKDWQRPALL